MKNTATGNPTFMLHLQNLGLLFATESMKPLNRLVLLMSKGPLMSIFNLSLNKNAKIQIITNPIA